MNLSKKDTIIESTINKITMQTPPEFNFTECLVFLGRSTNECLHYIEKGAVYKLLKVSGTPILLKITASDTTNTIIIEALNRILDADTTTEIADYVCDWFDLTRDLRLFYLLAEEDPLLRPVTAKYYGLRMLGIPDLFEALTWAMIGQQINLAFAYTLKRRFVEAFGEQYTYDERTFWLYPTPEAISKLTPPDLTSLQFTGKKSEYIIELAQKMHSGELSKKALQDLNDFAQIEEALIDLRGVGKWTANYVMMKCLKYMSAFPIEDVGLHNAIKQQLDLEQKPTIAEIRAMSATWSGWEAYATFYLWRSLYA